MLQTLVALLGAAAVWLTAAILRKLWKAKQ